MDERAKDKVVEEINPQRGIKSELNRVLSKNESLASSKTWNGATEQQYKSVRDRITATRTDKGLKYQKNGKQFIQVDKDNYKRVTREEDVYVNEETDTVWIRDSSGRFKEVIK